jgi:hypothetical protein
VLVGTQDLRKSILDVHRPVRSRQLPTLDEPLDGLDHTHRRTHIAAGVSRDTAEGADANRRRH